jgi:hypothetical protein
MTKIKVPTCVELNAVFDGLVTAMGFGFVGVDAVALRVCVFLGGRNWALVVRDPHGKSGAVDSEGQVFDVRELNLHPHVYADTKVNVNDSEHLLPVLAAATFEDLSVQLEHHGMQGGTKYMHMA